MLDTLVAPILHHMPALLAPAFRSIVPGEEGALLAQLRQLEAHLPEALTGTAGTAIAHSIHTAVGRVQQATVAGKELDTLEAKARQAVVRCAAEIARIAQQCQAEMLQVAVRSVVTGPVGASPPVLIATLAPIAAKHLASAREKLDALESELNQLAAEVRKVQIPDHIREAPAGPLTSGPAEASRPVESGPPSSGPVKNDSLPAGSLSNSPAGNSEIASPQAQAAVAAAKSALGTPYSWGGNQPGVGLDCSGLTHWAYAQAGVSIPRIADAQAVGAPITREQVQPGDLAVWDGHVAMIVDKGHFIEAGDPVQISPIRETNMGMNFKGYYRPTAS